ncbi:MAG: inner-rane translocator [Conexibacter sp.]|jgi:ribose transport system permease protein|nr:inner-rane translocator [Conexibacter sp.]
MSTETVDPQATDVAADPSKASRFGLRSRVLRDYGIVLILIVLFVVLAVANDAFLTTTNLLNILDQWAPLGIIAMGMTFVLISGGFDLSAGAIYALAGVIAAKSANELGVVPGILLGCLVGVAAGGLNGLLITAAKINAFVATLATSIIVGGITLAITNGNIVFVHARGFPTLARGELIGIRYPVLMLAAAIVLAALVLHKTAFGRYVYAAGGNPEAARLSGIRVGWVQTATYMAVGFGAGLAGTIIAARLSTATPDAGGYPLLFDVFSAVIIGGTSIAGGYGAIWRTVLGVLLLALIGNGFNLMNVDTVYQRIIFGAIILFAVWVDQMARRRSTR